MSACWPNPACAHFSTVGKLKNQFLNISNGWKDLKWRTFVACETDMKFNYWRPQIKFYWHTATRSCSVLSVTASMPLWQLELSWFKTRVLPRMPQTCTIRFLPENSQTNTRCQSQRAVCHRLPLFSFPISFQEPHGFPRCSSDTGRAVVMSSPRTFASVGQILRC